MNRMKWFERVFDFNYPLELFPCVVERLRGTPARLEELARALPTRILTAKVNDGWTIQEHVGHLFDLDELHAGRLEDYGRKMEYLRPADLSNRKTYEAAHNDAPLDRLLADFRATRLDFADRLDALDDEQVARSALHPRLQKRMRVIDMALFVAEHDDHHLASIREMARRLMR